MHFACPLESVVPSDVNTLLYSTVQITERVSGAIYWGVETYLAFGPLEKVLPEFVIGGSGLGNGLPVVILPLI